MKIRRACIRIIKKYDIDKVVSLSNSTKTRVRCLFGLKKYCNCVCCWWYELPVNLPDFNAFLKRVNAEIHINYVRHCDKDYFTSFLLPNKIVVLEFPSFLKRVNNSTPKSIKFGYFGAFHKNIREPFLLLNTFKDFDNVDIHLFTSIKNFYTIVGEDYLLPNNVKLFEEVRFEIFEKIIFDYSGLINVENVSTPFKQSKLSTYISTGLPIISFGLPDSKLNDLLTKHYSSYLPITGSANMKQIRAFLNSLEITSEETIYKFFNEYSSDYIWDVLIQ